VATQILDTMIFMWWEFFLDAWDFIGESINGVPDDDGGFRGVDGGGFEPSGDFSGGE
jgi:hypothetical protein